LRAIRQQDGNAILYGISARALGAAYFAARRVQRAVAHRAGQQSQHFRSQRPGKSLFHHVNSVRILRMFAVLCAAQILCHQEICPCFPSICAIYPFAGFLAVVIAYCTLADTPGGAGEGIPEANGQKVHEDEDYLFLAFAEAIFWTMKGYLLTIKLARFSREILVCLMWADLASFTMTCR
jgi:hypothetical protein